MDRYATVSDFDQGLEVLTKGHLEQCTAKVKDLKVSVLRLQLETLDLWYDEAALKDKRADTEYCKDIVREFANIRDEVSMIKRDADELQKDVRSDGRAIGALRELMSDLDGELGSVTETIAEVKQRLERDFGLAIPSDDTAVGVESASEEGKGESSRSGA